MGTWAQGDKAGPQQKQRLPPKDDTVLSEPGGVVHAKVKGDRTTFTPRSVLALQAQAGNCAVAALVGRGAGPAVQRHTITGAPGAPPQTDLDEEQIPLQGFWGRDPVVQRREPRRRVRLGAVAVSAKDLKADGASTLTASLPSAGSRKVTWGVAGPAGTAIHPTSGVVTAGPDAGGADTVKVRVTAKDDLVPTATASGAFTLWSTDAWQAKLDVAALLKSAPLVKKAFKASFNGVYDASYSPKDRLLRVQVPIQFDFPDDPITARMTAAQKEATRKRLAGYRTRFVAGVQQQWSGRFTFSNAREPKKLWGVLGPVRVRVRVTQPRNKSDAYFTVHYKSKTIGRAGVLHPDVDLFRGDLSPDRAFRREVLAGEKKQLQNISPPLNVDATGRLDAASTAAVKFLGDYVRRLRQPPVRLALVGKDKKRSSVGLVRARAARDALLSAGIRSPHEVSARGAVDPGDQRVHINPRVSASYVNFSDVSAHEFGHMIGLPDEYPEGARKIGNNLRTHARLVAAFGQDYADQVGKVTPNTASIMHGGDQVRVQHYIHFWDTLILTSNLHATAPAKKFGDADWKFSA